MIEFEKFLAPWEADENGKALAEPAEVDPEKLKKHLYNVLSDKEKAQTERDDKATELATLQEQVTTLQRAKESDDERRTREDAEREQRYADMEKRELDRAKVDFLQEKYQEKGIELARAKRLASKIGGANEQEWLAAAEAEIEDGFKLSTKAPVEQVEETVDTDLLGRPRVVRSDGSSVIVNEGKSKSDHELLAEAIPYSGGW